MKVVSISMELMNKRSLIAGWTLWASVASAQTMLPDVLSFNLLGSFANPVAEGSQPQFVTDNNLFNGYTGAFDLTDAPPSLTPSGPVGSAAFQWGKASPSSAYPHPSALWFEPLPVIDAAPEVAFTAGFLYYRNGILQAGSGVTGVDLLLGSPDSPGTIAPFSLSILDFLPASGSFGTTTASVSLDNLFAPIPFVDCAGNPYFVELAFADDLDFGDGSFTSGNTLRVAEGVVGTADHRPVHHDAYPRAVVAAADRHRRGDPAEADPPPHAAGLSGLVRLRA